MKKYQIINILSILTCIKPGSIPNFNNFKQVKDSIKSPPVKKFKFWLINKHILLQCMTIIFILYYASMELSYSTRVGTEIRNSVFQQRTNKEPNDRFSGPGWVVIFSLTLQFLNTVANNIVLRLLTIYYFPTILQIIYKIYQLSSQRQLLSTTMSTTTSNKERTSSSTSNYCWTNANNHFFNYKWSTNEISFLFIIIASQLLNVYASITASIEFLQNYTWSYVSSSPNTQAIIYKILDIIFIVLGINLSGSIVSEVISFVILTFVTFVTSKVKLKPNLKLKENSSNQIINKDENNYYIPSIFSQELLSDRNYDLYQNMTNHFNPNELRINKAPRRRVIVPIDTMYDFDTNHQEQQSMNKSLKNVQVPHHIQKHLNDSHIMQNNHSKDSLILYTKHYLQWYLFWKECQDLIGTITLVLFFNATLGFISTIFISITSSIDNGLVHPLTIQSFMSVVLIIAKLICFGNADYQLKLACQTITNVYLTHEYKSSNNEPSDLSDEKTRKIPYNCSINHYQVFSYERCLQDKIIMKLLHFFQNSPMNISALKYFDVSRLTLTNMAGVIVTYLIILLQFYWSQRQPNTTA